MLLLVLVCAGDYRLIAEPQPTAAQDVELAEGWKLTSASGLDADGNVISSPAEDAAWVPVRRMPGTVLQILEDAGVYPNLYYGKNLLTEVPRTCTTRLVVPHDVHRAGRLPLVSVGFFRYQLPG